MVWGGRSLQFSVGRVRCCEVEGVRWYAVGEVGYFWEGLGDVGWERFGTFAKDWVMWDGSGLVLLGRIG